MLELDYMWYQKYGQALNVVGPIQQPPILQPQTPVDEIPQGDDTVLPTPDAPQLVLPPVHDRCHCRIETMPGGRQIWQASHKPCPQCEAARDAFNDWQASLFGI